MMVRHHHQHHLMRVPHQVSVPLVNCMELQLRFLCPQDVEQVKLLCRDWFPIEYPDTWYQEITSNPRFFSLAATLSGSIIGLIVAEIKELNQLAKEDRSLLASCFLSNTKVSRLVKQNQSGRYWSICFRLDTFCLLEWPPPTGSRGLPAFFWTS